jgi:hypothetical protein
VVWDDLPWCKCYTVSLRVNSCEINSFLIRYFLDIRLLDTTAIELVVRVHNVVVSSSSFVLSI